MKLLSVTLDSQVVERLEPTMERPQNLCLDAGYDSAIIYADLYERGGVVHYSMECPFCQLTCQRRCRDRSGTACGRTREREWSASGGKGAQNQYRGWISAVSLY
jgi:hypothetical protein